MHYSISNWPRTRKYSQLLQVGKTFINMVTRWSRSMSNFNTLIGQNSDWSKFKRWVDAENLCSIWKLVYRSCLLVYWSWQNFVASSSDVFNRLFPVDVQNEKQLLSRFFRYSLFMGFLVQKCAPCQIHRQSNLGCYRFRFSHCSMRKRV